MREPAFWWRKPGIAARALAPLASAYGLLTARRLKRAGRQAAVPVVCIGDPTVGGAGKTPTAIAVAGLLAQAGERPMFLTRGYGGREAGPAAGRSECASRDRCGRRAAAARPRRSHHRGARARGGRGGGGRCRGERHRDGRRVSEPGSRQGLRAACGRFRPRRRQRPGDAGGAACARRSARNSTTPMRCW